MMKLQRGELLRIGHGAGARVTAHAGKVWITERANPRDVVLAPGESFRLGATGLVLVEALTDSTISFYP
jgi:hypothetical protein